jgi:hypothetical protein
VAFYAGNETKGRLMIAKMLTRLGLRRWFYRPYIPPSVDQIALMGQAAGYFGLPSAEVRSHYKAYRAFHLDQGYEQHLGERKTLCFEEAFLLYMAAFRARPSNVVEIGTQYGRSTRRIVDLLKLLGLDSKVTCFDVVDQVQFVSKNEIQLVLHDVTYDFSIRVLEKIAPGLIYLDAHPYMLVKNVITEFLKWSHSHPSVLAIHDCSLGLYNPNMRLSKEAPAEEIGSKTGHWERHVLSEVFAAPNETLDDLTSHSHRLRIFGTPHGLALVTPLHLLRQ